MRDDRALLDFAPDAWKCEICIYQYKHPPMIGINVSEHPRASNLELGKLQHLRFSYLHYFEGPSMWFGLRLFQGELSQYPEIISCLSYDRKYLMSGAARLYIIEHVRGEIKLVAEDYDIQVIR